VNLGPLEIGLIILAILLLFGYKKLPDASRSLGRSLRIFKGEMKGMKDDVPVSGDLTAQLQEEARVAEARAAELRARAEQTRAADGSR
jgi:sec-independent protein translocase protein TatA